MIENTDKLQFEQNPLGKVISVDTATVVIEAESEEKLTSMQVNRLVSLESGSGGVFLVGIIQKITRGFKEESTPNTLLEGNEVSDIQLINSVRISLIGTFFDRLDGIKNVFYRSLQNVPEIDAKCYPIEGELLTQFMQVISRASEGANDLHIGNYSLDKDATAYLNGNKFFQRHAVIVGSTGSGKSYSTAKIIEQISKLPKGNSIVFDIHNEYEPLTNEEGIVRLKIASPVDIEKASTIKDGVIHLPYWLLGYEDMVSMLVDRSDQNAPNQSMIMSRTIFEAKKILLEETGNHSVLSNFTIDSPVPYDLNYVLNRLINLNTERVSGARGGEKNGDFNGKLSRLIARLENKKSDRRLGFLFPENDELLKYDWLNHLIESLLGIKSNDKVKIIDFSEVPSDILPLVIGLVSRLVFSIHQWIPKEDRHPVSLFCDEAHLYIPNRNQSAIDEAALNMFERIAKEGRKYGVGLVVISQRPSEVNRTVLSQCSNFVAMRLTNADDQNVIRKLLPDSLSGFSDILPTLDIGEALVVGDASLLPTRIKIAKPNHKPNSGTIEFWDDWHSESIPDCLNKAIESWRRQSQANDQEQLLKDTA